MISVTDQMGQEIELQKPAARIISLVPSQTELLYDLGFKDEVLAITKFCIHPKEWFATKPRIGGTKNLNISEISSLNPDLIIGNKEENVKEQIEELRNIAPVYMSDVNDLQDALNMIRDLGRLSGKSEEAKSISTAISESFSKLPQLRSQKKVAYFIWKDPWMIAGQNTFINSMLPYLGLQNCTNSERYPEFDFEKDDPEIILLSTEPFPFKKHDVVFLQNKFPEAQIEIVDGELFSWYGSRLKLSSAYFLELREKFDL